MNRRIRNVVEGSPDVTCDYCYNAGWQCLEERKDSAADYPGNFSAFGSQPTARDGILSQMSPKHAAWARAV